MKKRYRYYTYKGFDINLKDDTLINGEPCIRATTRYSDTQVIYDEAVYWNGESMCKVKTLVQQALESYLQDVHGDDPDFVPFSETVAVRKNA